MGGDSFYSNLEEGGRHPDLQAVYECPDILIYKLEAIGLYVISLQFSM